MFHLIKAPNGVQFLTSDLLSCRHAFATRLGGVSRESHTASLNLAFDRGDEDAIVLKNLRLFAEAVGIAPESVISHAQIHSATVIKVDASMRGEGYFRKVDAACDGYVTVLPDIALGVKSADCVPILFEDPDAHVIGATHAGWRGAASGIAAECVRRMCELGASADNIRVAIGPAIHACCYEVSDDFLESVASFVGNEVATRYIKPYGAKLHADILGLNQHFLLESGVRAEHIDVCEFCTCCHPELFYSHRFSHGKRGTMLSVISL